MCVHVLNAQVAIQCQTCKGFFDCAECHDSAPVVNHGFCPGNGVVTFTCKQCQIVFQKDLATFDDLDKACPNCHTCFVMQAMTPEGQLHAHCMKLLDADLEEILQGF
ncbi:hypothetical protein JKP88DRAFT_161406 [Tribonema minus]|uniref:CHY-type domain-containing protein n=1 Tax=Tribonema minus TaxID=303371 RepID=A0A835ZAP3_9STRA|nr:hypothetical protein JKP88DRAFT_161406 [Tribonema minus]